MAMVEEFMMPHYDRIAAFARRHSVRDRLGGLRRRGRRTGAR